jgi:hypothetical protein
VTDTSPEQLKRNRQFFLRAFVLLAAIAGTVFYIGIWIWVFQFPNERRSGFELIAPFVGTIYFLILVVPCLYFGIKNYALGIAAAFGVFALGIALYEAYRNYPWFIY